MNRYCLSVCSSLFFLLIYAVSLLHSAGPGTTVPAVVHVRLPRPQHPIWGRELPGGRRLAYDRGKLFISRRYGLSVLTVSNRKWGYLPLPRSVNASPIRSFSVRMGRITVITEDGDVVSKWPGRSWRKVGRVRSGSGLLGSGALASWMVTSGEIRSNPAGKALFSLPFGSRVTGNALTFVSGWAYLGADSGLYRFAPGGKVWEALGARDHLTKASVQGITQWERGLVVVTARAQYARIPANVKMTSYGTFVYNYFQKRWDRVGQRVSPAQSRFLKHNRSNLSLPAGGIWLYHPPLPNRLSGDEFKAALGKITATGVVASLSPASAGRLLRKLYPIRGGEYRLSVRRSSREAWRLARVMERLGYRERAVRYGWKGLDFFRILQLENGKYWTATRRGIFEFRIREGRGEISPVAGFRKLYIDDLVRAGGDIGVLAGGRIYFVQFAEKRGKRIYNGFTKRENRGNTLLRKGDLSEVGRFVQQMERYLRSK